jgi:hypothetical protein
MRGIGSMLGDGPFGTLVIDVLGGNLRVVVVKRGYVGTPTTA